MFKAGFVQKIKGKLYLGIAPVIVGAILLCVYMILDVYPFGTRSISYYDMSQSFVPIYYHTWDVLHGIKQLFFDWNAGMGCSVTDVMGAFTLFPSNLFFLFIKRENILYSMSVFLMLKMMFAAFAMSFYASDKSSRKVVCIFAGISYACCGYILQYYTNIYFLDVVMIFPLLVLAMEKLITEGKKIAYIVLLFCVFLSNQQIAFTVVLYVIFKGWLAVSKLEKEKKGKAIQNLVFCSLAGFMLAGVSFIPSFYQMSQSARFGDATSGSLMDIFMSFDCEFFEQKAFMIYGCEIGIGCLIFILFNKEKAKAVSDKLVMIFLLAMPIAFENINLLWHGGAYQHFPMRFGYMLSFELIGLICYVAENKSYDEENAKKNLPLLICICLIPLIIFMLYMVDSQFRLQGIRELSAYKGYGFIVLALTVFGLTLCFVQNRKVVEALLISVAVIQAAIGTYCLVAPYGSYSLECGDVFPRIADNVHNNIRLEDDTNRVKDRNSEMNANYGFILGQSSLACWMNGINPNIQPAMIKMGYTANYTRVMDNGGTVFTDALLGIRRLYSSAEVNSSLYTDGEDSGTGKMYQCKYTLPFGVFLDDEIEGEGFNYQNKLFSATTGIEEELLHEIDAVQFATRYLYDEERNVYLYDIDVRADSEKVLYIYGNLSDDIYNKFTFIVNDEQKIIDAEGTEGNVMYALFFLNGFLELGTYENQNVNIKILTECESIDAIHIGMLDLETLEAGISKVYENTVSEASAADGVVTIDIKDAKGGKFFIPIGYSDNYTITVDGKNYSYYPTMDGAFIGMELEPGAHIINIKYSPKGLGIGLVLTIAGIACSALLFLDRKNVTGNKVGVFWCTAYKMIFGMMIVVFCFIPVFATFFVSIYRLLFITK